MGKFDYTVNSPFIRVFYKGQEITEKFEDLKYTASEEDDDECFLTIRSDKREIVDTPYFQDGATLVVTWGFIGTTVIAKRTIVVQDIDWTFDKENITGNLVGTEKGASLKYASSDEVHQNTSMVDVASKIAEKHGLTPKIELPDKENKDSASTPASSEKALENLINLGEHIQMAGGVGNYLPAPAVLVSIDSSLVKTFKDIADHRRTVDSVAQSLYGQTYQNILDQKNAGANINLLSVQRAVQIRAYLQDMKTYPFIAQGNKTDKQMLTEMGMKENGGPFIAETRDEDLIIRRRNWNRKPYKTMTYGAGVGDIIDYRTDPKDRHKKHSARNITFGAWDPMQKRYMEGNANAVNDTTQATLNKFEKLFDNYKKLVEKFPDAIVGFRDATKEVGSPRGTISSNIVGTSAFSDQTRVVRDLKVPIYAVDKLKILEQTINQLKGISPNKKIVDANNDGIEDAYQQASNLRNQSDAKKHPITAKAYGDVGIWPGQILTILGVGRKHSGNHYVTKSTHMVKCSEGYIVEIEMAMKGVNIKTGDSDVSTKEMGKTRNTQTGPNTGTGNTRTITIH